MQHLLVSLLSIVLFPLFQVATALADAPGEFDRGSTHQQPVRVDNDSTDQDRSHRSEVVESAALTKDSSRSLAVAALLYIPSRALDLIDIFRARIRVGPGFAAGVRATDAAQLYVGGYTSVYAGLPGPRRGAQMPRSPIGLESRAGAAVSLADATVSGGMDPGYSSTEIDLGLQGGILGVDVGVDPLEIADFLVGIVGFDMQGDDL